MGGFCCSDSRAILTSLLRLKLAHQVNEHFLRNREMIQSKSFVKAENSYILILFLIFTITNDWDIVSMGPVGT